eukprot:349816-Chlamydomonas_euryale.AAC.3
MWRFIPAHSTPSLPLSYVHAHILHAFPPACDPHVACSRCQGGGRRRGRHASGRGEEPQKVRHREQDAAQPSQQPALSAQAVKAAPPQRVTAGPLPGWLGTLAGHSEVGMGYRRLQRAKRSFEGPSCVEGNGTA